MPLWLVADDIGDELRGPLERRLPWKTIERHSLGSFRAAPFQSKALLRMRPDLGLTSCFDPAPRWTMHQSDPDNVRDMLVVRPSDGIITVEQDGRRQTCEQREAIILDAGRSATFVMNGISRIDCLVVASGPDQPIEMQHIAHDNGGLIALGHYAAAVMRGLLPMNSAALTTLAVDYMNGLVATMIAEASSPPRGTSQIHDRLTLSLLSIKADIEARLNQPTLSLERFATTHGVTARYFQKLFEAEGRTFSDYLLERRLERAYQALRSGRDAHRSVSSIAFDVGFGDLSYFNRTFKKRFGATPREVRAEFEKMAGDEAERA
ncbi:MAG: Helix-turn-helix protein [Tardiphaga sp.]|nr:Helix-turn-helix protein [Tardiphaga sp.]